MIVTLISWLLGINGILMIVAATIQIISRALGTPVAWTVEVLIFLGLFSIVPGTAVVFLKGEEIKVGFIVDNLPCKLAMIIECATACLSIFFGIVLIWANIDYRELVSMGNPEQYLPFPPETNTWPLYLLGLAIIWGAARNLRKKLLVTCDGRNVNK